MHVHSAPGLVLVVCARRFDPNMTKGYSCGLLLAVSLSAFAQTKLDLGAQSKDPNFSQAPSATPFPTGSALPATCTVGQFFFLTVAPVGANQCVLTNTWAPIQGSSGNTSSNVSTGGTIGVQKVSSTQLAIGSGCSVATPCLYRVGSSVYSLLAPATATVSGGSGLAFMYIDNNGNVTVGVSSSGNPGVNCAGCLVTTSVTQYPLGMIPLETWNATSGTWDPTGTNAMAMLSVPPALLAGSSITVAQTPANVTISYTGVDGASTAPSPIGTFNPTDPTQFYINHLALDTGFARGQDGWDYSGGCGGGTAPAGTPFPAETVVGGVWGQAAGSGTVCFFYFPSDHNTSASGASHDYWSGTTPGNLWVSGTYMSADVNGTQYVGLSSSGNAASDFIGCRQIGAGDWFSVIRAGGTDLATADTGYPHDTNAHRLTVDNNSAVANTIRCSVDGASTATAVATIPSESYGWYFVVGAISSGAAAANFGTYQYIIFLQGLPRL